jgi:hypothetical protein
MLTMQALRARGLDVVSTADAGRRGRSDIDQLAFATAEGRMPVTRNVRDFAAIHQHTIEAGDSQGGVIAITRQQFAIGEYATALARLAGSFTPQTMKDRMEYLSNWL